MHRIHLGPEDPPPTQGHRLTLSGDEAHHAVRVKRLRAGEPVELLDGAGLRASGTVSDARRSDRGSRLIIDVLLVERAAPSRTRIHVMTPAPKGDRLTQMIDQLSQVGAATWTPLRCARAGEPPNGKAIGKLRRIAVEAMKQCGRAWVLGIEPARSLDDVLGHGDRGLLVITDQAGDVTLPAAESVSLLVGPEGGFNRDEIARAREAGAVSMRLGPHILRVETAAVAASVLAGQILA